MIFCHRLRTGAGERAESEGTWLSCHRVSATKTPMGQITLVTPGPGKARVVVLVLRGLTYANHAVSAVRPGRAPVAAPRWLSRRKPPARTPSSEAGDVDSAR